MLIRTRFAFSAWVTSLALLAWLAACATVPLPTDAVEEKLSLIKLPPGFRIHVYAVNLPGARSMALGAQGTLFVGTRRTGRVYAVVDRNRDHRADEIITLAKDLYMPNGVAFRDGALYVAEVDRVHRFDNIEANLRNPRSKLIHGSLPKDGHHGWKFIRFGPDGWLYVPVGAPCNICDRGDPYAAILRMKPDGENLEVFARGVRNTVGFDWHPETKELWFTDNGRDWMGDDTPPDELNRAPTKGLHFGYPFCHGGDIPDPKFGALKPCSTFRPPAQKLGPHVAALGMRFYTGRMFPEEYRNQIFIAEHGSWNRSAKVGYRITIVRLEGNRAVSYEPFAEGWLQGQSAWGRPVDLLVMPDGSMLVSDDRAGVIYRMTYEP